MGGTQSAIFQQGQPLSNYDIVQKVPEHNISYLKHKTTNKQYMIREFAINDKTEFAQTCEKIKNRKKMQSTYLTKLERYSEQMEDNMCSSFYKIFAMWEYPTHTLADEINERALQKRRFQQNELFSIIASIIEGMSCLQSSGVKHECLSTSSILFDQTGTVKVADPLTSLSPSNFDRINTNRKSKSVYISPQQCESLKNQRPIPNRNPYKSDVFILGVIMLQCGLLQSTDGIFVENFQDVDLQGLNEKLEMFGRVYSKDLKLTVQTMLTRDPKERMDWIGLKQYVPQKNQDHSNRTITNTTSSFGYKPQITSQPVSYHKQQAPGKITLGGGGSKMTTNQLSFNTRQALINNPLPKFHPEITKLQAQTHYASTLIHTASNQPFTKQIPSYTYQPLGTLTSTNFASSNANYVPPVTIHGFNGLNSNLYGNATTTKVSNYVLESKVGYERPTEEYFVNNLSKANSGVPTALVDRQSSSFPLNSQLQFKKDYLTTGNITYNTPAYDSNFSSGKNPVFAQNFNNFSSYSGLDNAATVPYLSSESKSFVKNQKTQIASNSNNSPLLSHHVKDAKSVTYDKNLYSSYITEEKNSYAIQHDGGYYGQQRYAANYQGIENGHGNGYYQPINKIGQQHFQVEAKNVSLYVPSSGPVLYQPLSSVGVKEKPSIMVLNPLQDNYISQPQKPIPTNVFTSRTIHNQPQNPQQPYYYKQINPQSSSTVQNMPQIPQVASSTSQQLQYVIQHFKQGSRYQGTKYQDMRHGQGKFFYQDGGMYEGNWKFNKMDGFGKLYYQSGKIAYQGNWNQDQFQGYGKLYNEQCDTLQQPFDYGNFDLIDEYWVYYEGNFVADQKDGEGKMVFSNGEFFLGNFHNDMLDGPGEFHRMNGEVVTGLWAQNQLVQVQE